jgi:hypothetical protein
LDAAQLPEGRLLYPSSLVFCEPSATDDVGLRLSIVLAC